MAALQQPTTPYEASRWHPAVMGEGGAQDANGRSGEGATPQKQQNGSQESVSQGANGATANGGDTSAQKDKAAENVDSVSGIVPTLQNIVATVNLDCRLDLKTIALHARNAEYNPKRFAAVIMRIRQPKTTALIFASGKMVVTGAKSEQDRYGRPCSLFR